MGKIFPLRKNMLRIFLQFRYASNSSEIISKNIINIASDFNKKNKKLVNYENKSFDENNNNDHDDDESMFVKTQFNDFEWGGPLRGGTHLEPTRFGDWDKKVLYRLLIV